MLFRSPLFRLALSSPLPFLVYLYRPKLASTRLCNNSIIYGASGRIIIRDSTEFATCVHDPCKACKKWFAIDHTDVTLFACLEGIRMSWRWPLICYVTPHSITIISDGSNFSLAQSSRPFVPHLNRPKLASNIYCDTTHDDHHKIGWILRVLNIRICAVPAGCAYGTGMARTWLWLPLQATGSAPPAEGAAAPAVWIAATVDPAARRCAWQQEPSYILGYFWVLGIIPFANWNLKGISDFCPVFDNEY